MEVGLGPGNIVLDGDPAPPPRKGTAAPDLSVHICGQTAGWIKIPLGTKVVLDPPRKEAQHPTLFGPLCCGDRVPSAELLLLYVSSAV